MSEGNSNVYSVLRVIVVMSNVSIPPGPTM